MRPRLLIVVAVALVVVSGPMMASTTGQLSGRVVDDQGSPLPGVSVSAKSPAQIGGEQFVITDLGGMFLYPLLAPGHYTVRIQLDGFVTQELTGVQVRLDRLTEVRAKLPSAQFGEQLNVTEQAPVIDPSQVSIGQTFTSEYLELTSVGAGNRGYWDALSQAAGSSEILRTGRLETSVLGSSFQENTYLIDGLDTTDVYYGGVGSYLNFEAIDEISLQTGGFGAEYGRATGGVVNLVTKSGGNDFQGVFDGRYRANSFEASGEFHNPEEQESRFLETTLSLGGPIARDKVWFFVSGLYRDSASTPFQSPTTRGVEGYNVLGKITWQLSPAWRLMGKYNAGDFGLPNFNASQFRQPEATNYLEQIDDVMQLDASGLLTDRLLWGGQIGRNLRTENFFPESGDTLAPSHYNWDTDIRSGNTNYYYEDDRTRNVIRSDLTFFADEVAGSHQIKGGLEYHQVLDEWIECDTGDPTESGCAPGSFGYSYDEVLDPLGNDFPFLMWVTENIGEQKVEGDLMSAFLQDSWRVRPDLTLNLGLRWDGIQYTNSYGSQVADLDKLQPRVGAAWDVTGTGRNVLRASWGQFMHPGTLGLPTWSSSTRPLEIWYSCSWAGPSFGFDPGLCPFVAESFGWGWRTDPWNQDAAGWILDPTNVFTTFPSEVAEGLKPSYNEQLILGFEREIYRRTSLELSYVQKDTKDGIDNTCWGNVPEPTPGAPCDYFVIANLPEIRKEYKAWMLRFESRPTDRVHVLGSYVYSESKGSVWRSSTGLEGTFDIYPYHYVNRFGYLPDHRRHRVKLNGYARLPLDFNLGFAGWWSSPLRWTPVDYNVPGMAFGEMFVEPRGSGEAEDNHQLDLQVSKGFRLGPTRLQLIAAVYNLLSVEQPIRVCDDVDGCGDFDLGDPLEWQLPRRFELGLRVEF